MSIDKVFVTIFGFIGAVVIFQFLLKRDSQAVKVEESLDIIVDGGYSPERISVVLGKPVQINFIRKDANPCLEEVNLPEFRIKKYLPLNEKVSINIKPVKKGKYEFVCSMGMYHGQIIVS